MRQGKSILVVDDDQKLRELLQEYLESRGFSVFTATGGRDALSQLGVRSPDLIVLDVMMPDLDGFEVCREIRKTRTTPVLMLTARGDDMDKIVGLELGADDYLSKPFNPRELVARIQAVLRRAQVELPVDQEITVGALKIVPARHEAILSGRVLDLTATEFDVLRALAENAGRVISRDRLMEIARGPDFASFDRSVDVHVSHLRKKLGDDPKKPAYLKTVRGVGYTLVAQGES